MRLPIFALPALLCAACATTPTYPEPQDYTRAVGDRFAGRPISEMLGRYGAPARQQSIAGEQVMTWERLEYLDFGRGPEPYRCQLDA